MDYLLTIQDDAQLQYIKIVEELVAKESPASETSSSSSSSGKFSELLVNNSNGIYAITLNRPKKKNAINYEVGLLWICSGVVLVAEQVLMLVTKYIFTWWLVCTNAPSEAHRGLTPILCLSTFEGKVRDVWYKCHPTLCRKTVLSLIFECWKAFIYLNTIWAILTVSRDSWHYINFFPRFVRRKELLTAKY